MVSFLIQRILISTLDVYRRSLLWWHGVTGYWKRKHLTSDEHRVVSGQAWADFCDALKAAGAAMLAPGAPSDPFNQAEGYRYLTRILRGGLENFVECCDVQAPQLCSIADGHRSAPIKLGSDNPDNLYQSATIDGTLSYLITGVRGNVPYLGFGTQSGVYGEAGGLKTVAYLEADQLVYDDAEKQHFRILLSPQQPQPDQPHASQQNLSSAYDVPPNWLKLIRDPPSAMFIVRQTFNNRSMETAADVHIQVWNESSCLQQDTISFTKEDKHRDTDIRNLCTDVRKNSSSSASPVPLTAAALEKGLKSTSLLVAGASVMFANWAHGFQRHSNQLPLFNQTTSDGAGGDPNIRYYHSYWNIPVGKALLIKFQPPKCRCWNFQLNNHWMESLDYRYHPVHTNSYLACPDPQTNDKVVHDDTVAAACYTIIVSHSNPNVNSINKRVQHVDRDENGDLVELLGDVDRQPDGFMGNWVYTTGHECGTMCLRWVFNAHTAPAVENLPVPNISLVDASDLRPL